MIIETIQIVTERYMVKEDDRVYFTMYVKVRKLGEGSCNIY